MLNSPAKAPESEQPPQTLQVLEGGRDGILRSALANVRLLVADGEVRGTVRRLQREVGEGKEVEELRLRQSDFSGERMIFRGRVLDLLENLGIQGVTEANLRPPETPEPPSPKNEQLDLFETSEQRNFRWAQEAGLKREGLAFDQTVEGARSRIAAALNARGYGRRGSGEHPNTVWAVMDQHCREDDSPRFRQRLREVLRAEFDFRQSYPWERWWRSR